MGYHPFDYVIYTRRLHPASRLTLSLSPLWLGRSKLAMWQENVCDLCKLRVTAHNKLEFSVLQPQANESCQPPE